MVNFPSLIEFFEGATLRRALNSALKWPKDNSNNQSDDVGDGGIPGSVGVVPLEVARRVL